MRAVIGLGNPGKKYELTRHNVGFFIIDLFSAKHKLTLQPSKNDYFLSEGRILSSDFFLLKPTTFMNLSGTAILDFVNKHSIPIENLLIIVDDINLELGKIRIRKSGSDGGHNGLKSIIYHLQSDQFPRLRLGVGSKFEKGELSNYVLKKFSKTELTSISSSMEFSTNLIEQFIIGGYKSMMDLYSKHRKFLRISEEKNSN